MPKRDIPVNGPTGRQRGWRIAFLVVCTVALCLSADLVRLHVRVHTDPSYQAYCAISEKVDCATVALSDQSVFLGLPVAVWGLWGYLALFVLTVLGLRTRLRVPSWPFGLLFWLSLFCSLLGLVLGLVAVLLIRSSCLVCLGTYACNLLLLLLAGLELKRLGSGPLEALREELGSLARRPRPAIAFVVLFALLLAGSWLGIPRYWAIEASTGPGGLNVGATREGLHWIGARRPKLEVVEFSDYQCPFCQRAYDKMRQLLAQHPDEVRLIHRHYPLDAACNRQVRRSLHPLACDYAYMAECAGEQERFWEANDYLFQHGRRAEPVTPAELAQELGLTLPALEACLASDVPRARVQADLEAGWKLHIRGTPTFVVGEELYPGNVPAEVIQRALGER